MTVYVVQEVPGRNIASARQYGDFEVLLPSNTNKATRAGATTTTTTDTNATTNATDAGTNTNARSTSATTTTTTTTNSTKIEHCR